MIYGNEEVGSDRCYCIDEEDGLSCSNENQVVLAAAMKKELRTPYGMGPSPRQENVTPATTSDTNSHKI